MTPRYAPIVLLLAAIPVAFVARAGATGQYAPTLVPGSILATPNLVLAGAGPGATTISWTTTYGDAEVRVSIDGAPDRIFATGRSGSKVANWIQAGHDYEFRLYTSGSPAMLLARTKVIGAKPSSPPAAIDANPRVLAAGPGQGSTTITWTTGDGSDGEVRVSIDQSPERLAARGKLGVLVADWIQGGSTYDFKLYASSRPEKPLATVQVSRAAAPPGTAWLRASPNPVPAGAGAGQTTITWTTGDGSDGRVRVSVDGGLEGLVGKGSTGTLRVDWINSNSSYEFSLYASANPAKPLSNVKVSRAGTSTAPITPPSIDLIHVDVPGSPGKTRIRVNWTTGDRSDGVVYVSTDGGPGQVFLQSPSGSVDADWILDTSSYEFSLYAVSSRTLLAKTKLPARVAPATTTQVKPLSPTTLASVRSRSFLSAVPNPVPAGIGAGATEISWSVDAIGHGIVMLAVDGAKETQVAAKSAGRITAGSIRAGSRYEFRLYGGQPSELLQTVVVTRRSAMPWVVAGSVVTLVIAFLRVIGWRRAAGRLRST